jgi:hypothetical protein
MATLAEDLFLLASEDATGRMRIPATHVDLGLGGALLLDLVLSGRVTLTDYHVTVIDPASSGDPMLDAALAAIAADDKPREPEYWVRHLARGARAAVESRLVEAGVLQPEDHKVLGFIPVHHTHHADTRIEHQLVDHLYEAVVQGRPASRETTAVASLVLAVGLERYLFPRSDHRAVRHRMEEIAEGEWVGAAVKHTIDAVNAALGVGVVPERTDVS